MRAAKPASPGFSNRRPLLGPDRSGAMTPQHHPVQTVGRLPGAAGLTLERRADHIVSGELDVSSTPSLRERPHVALQAADRAAEKSEMTT